MEALEVEAESRAETLRFTINVGIAAFGDGADTPERLVRAADSNLCRAKDGGRNQVVAAAPDVQLSP